MKPPSATAVRMGLLRKKNQPYEVPDQVSGTRSEIDDFRSRLRQDIGGEQAKENPELANLKEQYGDRLTNHIDGAREDDEGLEQKTGRDRELESLLGSGDFNPYVSKNSFSSPSDTTPSAFVPGLDSPPAKKPQASRKSGAGQFACDDCGADFKERWTTCPKCGGKVSKTGLDPEVEQLRAQAEGDPGAIRQVDPNAQLDSFQSQPVSEFGRSEGSIGTRGVDDLLTDFSDSAAGPPPTASRAEGFACDDCGAEYKEKWGKCPKCGGNVERARAPEEVSRIENRHQAIEGMEPVPRTPSPPREAPQSSAPALGGSGLLDELVGPAPSPAPAPKAQSPDLEELTPQSAEPPRPGESPLPAADEFAPPKPADEPSQSDFAPSTSDPAPPAPSGELEDLTADLGLPDKEEEPTPEADEDEEKELTMEEVGIRQADMGTDFSFRKPRGRAAAPTSGPTPAGSGPARTVKRKKKTVKRKVAGPPPARARPQPASHKPYMPQRERPPAGSAPAAANGRSARPPRPDELKSDLLDLLKEPTNKKRRK